MAERSLDHQPHDLGVEKSALGAALMGSAADLKDDGLTGELFYRHAHRLVWEACEVVLDGGGDPDLQTVGAQLRSVGKLDEVKEGYFSKLVDGAPRRTAANLLWIVGRLEELHQAREILKAEDALRTAISVDANAVTDGTVDRHIEALDALRQRRQKTTPWYGVAQQWESLKQEAKRTAEGSVCLGIPELDSLIDGVRPGEVFGLMARPGIGKTVVVCHQARWMAYSGLPHVFFSLEMPAAQIVTRLCQAEYGESRAGVLSRVRSGTLPEQTYTERFEAMRLVDRGGLSVTEISQRLRRIQDREFSGRAVRAITIDHLGLIGGDRKLSTYDRVSLHVREIKELAKNHNVAVLLVIQVNRDGGDGSEELHLGSARDSGVVEEVMDYLVGIRRFDRAKALAQVDRDRYRDVLFLKVVKHRHAPPHNEVSVQFDHTLDLTPISMAIPEAASKVAHFGGRR